VFEVLVTVIKEEAVRASMSICVGTYLSKQSAIRDKHGHDAVLPLNEVGDVEGDLVFQ
jgi:hypothetical protein